MAQRDPHAEYDQAVSALTELSESVARQQNHREVLEAITRLRLAVARAYGGSRPRQPHGSGARQKILAYLQEHSDEWVYGDELAAVSGIGEWARRVRELRVEAGYDIVESAGRYRLRQPDPDVARRDRWQIVGEIQASSRSQSQKVLTLLSQVVGSVVNVDELNRVAGSQDGARLARLLRSEEAHPIETSADAPDLGAGEFRLASLLSTQQLPAGQELFSEDLRRQLFGRDGFRCSSCGSRRETVSITKNEPFFLLVRHLDAAGADVLNLSVEKVQDLSRLMTVCNRCVLHAGV